MVLGGGPNRIAAGIELTTAAQYAGCAKTVTRPSWSTVTRKPSPPTTTLPDRLQVLSRAGHAGRRVEIVRIEVPKGVIVQYGGQTPLKLARWKRQVCR